MNLLLISGQLSPISGDDSMGRVVASYAAALGAAGHKVTACVPLCDPAAVDRWSLARRLSPIEVELPGRVVPVYIHDGRLPSGVEIKVLGNDELFLGSAWDDGDMSGDAPLRHAVLARAALALAAAEPEPPAIVHGVSLTGALACHLAAKNAPEGAKTVLSIEGVEDHGRCPKEWVERLGLGWEGFSPEGFEFYGDLSLLKAGLVAADRVLLPGYTAAADARSDGNGKGLEGVVTSRADAVTALLPGLDYATWNPATDAHLASRYDAELVTGKLSCKADLQNRLGLPVRGDLPLLAILPSLKDLAAPLAQVLDRLLRAEVQLVAPRGLARPLEASIDDAIGRWPDKVARVELDERAEHQLLAGADLALLDAPRDLEAHQLLSTLRYGALPIARREGLARDLLVDLTGTLESGNGFVVSTGEPTELLSTLRRAIGAFGRCGGEERPILAVTRRAMALRCSWEDVAGRLEQLYGELLQTASAEPCANES